MASGDVERWTQLDFPPETIPDGVIAAINETEFILSSRWIPDYAADAQKINGLYIFNSTTNKWKLWMKYPDEWKEVWHHILMFDSKQNCLYLWHKVQFSQPGKLRKIDIKTQKYQTIKDIDDEDDDGISLYVVGKDTVVTSNDIHFIGGGQERNACNRHIKFDKNKKKFQEIHKFEQFDSIYTVSMVYVKSKDVILIFGGSGQKNGIDIGGIGMMEFSLNTQKWTKIENITYNFYDGHAMLTKDEKNVILVPNLCFQDGISTATTDIYRFMVTVAKPRYQRSNK